MSHAVALKSTYDVVTVGAGVVGLAIARRFAMRGKSVLVVEKESAIGMHSSTRNSGIIHAGIFDAPDSLKSRLCAEGKPLFYEYCKAKGIRHSMCGNFIVATAKDQHSRLEDIMSRGKANGVTGLEWRTPEEVKAVEPSIRCTKAIFSQTSGVVDQKGLLEALHKDCVEAGAQVALNCQVERVRALPTGDFLVHAQNGVQTQSTVFVNCAGLWAPKLAENIDGLDRSTIPTPIQGKSRYFKYTGGESPFSHLVQPCGSGSNVVPFVHATLDPDGNLTFGHNLERLDAALEAFDSEPPYGTDGGPSLESVENAIRCYYPDLRGDSLEVPMSGIRTQLKVRGEMMRDFVIHGPSDHGVPGLLNLYGIESPGLTAVFSIADYASQLLESE